MRGRAQPQDLVDEKIGNQCPDPSDRQVGIDGEDRAEGTIDAQLHQQQRDRDVEDQPNDASGVAVREPRKEVRPRDRAGIRVRHVDFDLRQNDEKDRYDHDRRVGREQISKTDPVHLDRLGRLIGGQAVLHGDDRQ